MLKSDGRHEDPSNLRKMLCNNKKRHLSRLMLRAYIKLCSVGGDVQVPAGSYIYIYTEYGYIYTYAFIDLQHAWLFLINVDSFCQLLYFLKKHFKLIRL